MSEPTPTTEQARCRALSRAGRPCGAIPPIGHEYCAMHDPARTEEMHAIRSKGGTARVLPSPAPPADLSTAQARRAMLELTIDRMRAGGEPVNLGRAVISAVAVAVQVAAQEELISRLDQLEQAMRIRQATPVNIAESSSALQDLRTRMLEHMLTEGDSEP